MHDEAMPGDGYGRHPFNRDIRSKCFGMSKAVVAAYGAGRASAGVLDLVLVLVIMLIPLLGHLGPHIFHVDLFDLVDEIFKCMAGEGPWLRI